MIRSIVPLLNVCIIIVITWIMFGIVAVSLLGNRMHRCDIDDYYGIDKEECLKMGQDWSLIHWNYDNVLEAIVSLFVLSSMEDWPNLVGDAIDSSYTPWQGPIFNNRPWMWAYFMVFIFISKSPYNTRFNVFDRFVLRCYFLSVWKRARY